MCREPTRQQQRSMMLLYKNIWFFSTSIIGTRHPQMSPMRIGIKCIIANKMFPTRPIPNPHHIHFFDLFELSTAPLMSPRRNLLFTWAAYTMEIIPKIWQHKRVTRIDPQDCWGQYLRLFGEVDGERGRHSSCIRTNCRLFLRHSYYRTF